MFGRNRKDPAPDGLGTKTLSVFTLDALRCFRCRSHPRQNISPAKRDTARLMDTAIAENRTLLLFERAWVAGPFVGGMLGVPADNLLRRRFRAAWPTVGAGAPLRRRGWRSSRWRRVAGRGTCHWRSRPRTVLRTAAR